MYRAGVILIAVVLVGCAMPMSSEEVARLDANRLAALRDMAFLAERALECPDSGVSAGSNAQLTTPGEVACSFQRVMVTEKVDRWFRALGASGLDVEVNRDNQRGATGRLLLTQIPFYVALASGGFGGGGGTGCDQDIEIVGSSFGSEGASDEAETDAATGSFSIGGCGNVQDSEDILAGFNNRFSRILKDAEGSIGRNPQNALGELNEGSNNFAPLDDRDSPDVGINPF